MEGKYPPKNYYPDTTSLVLALKDCLNGMSTTTASTGVPGVSEYLAGKWTLYLVPTLPLGKPFAFNVPSNGTYPIAIFCSFSG